MTHIYDTYIITYICDTYIITHIYRVAKSGARGRISDATSPLLGVLECYQLGLLDISALQNGNTALTQLCRARTCMH